MNIESTANKFLAPVDKYGELIGAAGVLFAPNSPNGIGAFMDSFNQIAAGSIHAPEVNNIVRDTMQKVVPLAAYAVAGYIIKDATSNGTISKVGSITQKVATGAAMVTLANIVLWYSTHSPPMGNNAGIATLAQQTGSYTNTPLAGSTLNQSGMQNLANPQSVYQGRTTAGSLYTVASGSRLIGN